MRALHLPGVASNESPAYSFPDHPPSSSALQYTALHFPLPRALGKSSFLVRVLTTSFTRSELTWHEVLNPARFSPHGGAIPGHDFVGVIEKVMPSRHIGTGVKEGDVVWGLVDFDRDGAAADYVIALENEVCLAPTRPDGVEEDGWNEQLATLPLSALTAWQALFLHGALREQGDKNNRTTGIIILGSGAVARAAIELAKCAGLFPKVVASSRGAEMLAVDYVPSHLGERQIIADGPQLLQDLTSVDTVCEQQELISFNLIFDTTGGLLVSQLLLARELPNFLKPGGKIVSIAAPLSAFGADIEQEIRQNCEAAQVSFQFFVVKPDKDELGMIGRFVEDGDLKGYVESVWPLEKGREAMNKVETRGAVKKGKVVLNTGL